MIRSQAVTLDQHPAGIPLVKIDNESATALVSLFGGQVLSFVPKADKRERLWLSDNAPLDGSVAIRGGIPICWPWFGPNTQCTNAPQHGFLRTQLWELVSASDSQEGTILLLEPTSTTSEHFPSSCSVKLQLVIGTALTVKLIVRNTSASSISFGAALHTYLRVDDIRDCELRGLKGNYLDKLAAGKSTPTPVPYYFDQHLDRIHQTKTGALEVYCSQQLAHQLDNQGHDSIVVWNPWAEKSATMADMSATGYLTMLCVEAAITAGQSLQPGEQHTLTQRIA